MTIDDRKPLNNHNEDKGNVCFTQFKPNHDYEQSHQRQNDVQQIQNSNSTGPNARQTETKMLNDVIEFGPQRLRGHFCFRLGNFENSEREKERERERNEQI